MDEVREIALRATDLPIELRIKLQGLLALVNLARNDRIAATSAADEAMRLTQGQRPVYFGTYFGYVGPATVYLAEWEAGASPEVRAKAEDAIKRLKAFANVFPIGQARYGVSGRPSRLARGRPRKGPETLATGARRSDRAVDGL